MRIRMRERTKQIGEKFPRQNEPERHFLTSGGRDLFWPFHDPLSFITEDLRPGVRGSQSSRVPGSEGTTVNSSKNVQQASKSIVFFNYNDYKNSQISNLNVFTSLSLTLFWRINDDHV